MRLEHTFQHFSALRGLRIGYAHAGNVETPLRIPLCITFADAQGGLRDEAEPSPLKIRTQFENICHRPERCVIAFPRNHALVLVFDLRLVRFQLAQNHNDGLQNIQWLKTGDRNWFVFVFCDPFVRPATNHGGHVAGADERVDAHVGRIQNCPDRWNDGYVIAEDGKIVYALSLGSQKRQRG